MNFRIGQRWISEMEPELGLGVVKHVDNRTVLIHFSASKCERKFAISSAPLKRVLFKAGDNIESKKGIRLVIKAVSSENGINFYHGDHEKIAEYELSDTLSFTSPYDRLLHGFIDNNRDFNLRYRTLFFQYQTRKSTIRGFVGGRIELIPHQLYVAYEVTSQQIPRVLLSDETGLGKTIEVCLILHRLLLNERINRVLIVVPDALVHQWFIELFRRFNLNFRIFDTPYFNSTAAINPENNPFLDTQLGICSIDFLNSNLKLAKLAVTAQWDMLVIDEAHHLTAESSEYRLAEQLSSASKGLMLLTATPEQLGHFSHFLRLQLIDPARYHDFDLFEREEKQYSKIAALLNRLLETGGLDKQDQKILTDISPGIFENIKKNGITFFKKNPEFQQHLIKDLLDRYGTGRAVFRNSRATMSGFPKRIAHLTPLEATIEDRDRITTEFQADSSRNLENPAYNYKKDPRLIWLVQFLQKHKKQKVLLICHTVEKARAIEIALRKWAVINLALFHEQLTLLQRDRNAAWFANKNGAQILICSEIGSEGRNFQFSHHLVLFDLPLDPELLEQRIGRLDRIGQEKTIHIYVPFLTGSEYEILARWYHAGLNAFEKNVAGVYQIYQKMGDEIKERALARRFSGFDNLLKRTQKMNTEISQKLKEGRDRLLELNSFQPDIAEKLIKKIQTADSNSSIKKYMMDVFHSFGIGEELVADRIFQLNLTLLSNQEFPLPVLKNDPIKVTFDREIGLIHEDIEFLSSDHPMFLGIMDLILGSEKGNCAVAHWPDGEINDILLEVVYVLECIAPKSLFVDRFLSPTPIRMVVDHLFQNRSKQYPVELFAKCLENSTNLILLEHPEFKQGILPGMLKQSKKLAEETIPLIVRKARHKMESQLTGEIKRLTELKNINKNIREEEISSCRQELKDLQTAIDSARLRLDSLRLITPG